TDPIVAGLGVPVPCAGDDAQAPPASVTEVVDRLSALAPDSVACLVASLPRPLPLEATDDVFSAQPAVGARSPRLFVQYPGLTLTVVPEGPGASLVELGEADPSHPGLTIKAELAFPLDLSPTGPLDPMAPYDRVVDGEGTRCGVCHPGEVEVRDGVFASVPFQPLSTRRVPIDAVRAEAEACPDALDPGGTDDRCALLRAVFGGGPVFHAPFPADTPTIYDPPAL
ncbi:MAG: hypothetical protein ABMB14_10085, partial [Myxococcota bacterium]